MTETLNKDELSTLLQSLEPSSSELSPPENGIQKCELAEERICRGRLPGLELVHESFVRAWRKEFSNIIGHTAQVHLESVDKVRFQSFVKKLPLPSSLHLYRMLPFSGHALIVVSTPLVFSTVNALFGGGKRRTPSFDGRDFSDLETKIMAKMAAKALETLKQAWTPLHAVDFVYTQAEFNPLALSIASPSEDLVVARITVEFNEDSGELLICTPYAMLDPIREKLERSFQSNRPENNAKARKNMEKSLKSVKVNVSVELAQKRITPRELLELKEGDILSFDTRADGDVVIRVEGRPKFKGKVGSSGSRRSVKIQGKI